MGGADGEIVAGDRWVNESQAHAVLKQGVFVYATHPKSAANSKRKPCTQRHNVHTFSLGFLGFSRWSQGIEGARTESVGHLRAKKIKNEHRTWPPKKNTRDRSYYLELFSSNPSHSRIPSIFDGIIRSRDVEKRRINVPIQLFDTHSCGNVPAWQQLRNLCPPSTTLNTASPFKPA